MADVQMTLGDKETRFRFSVDTAAYDRLERRTTANWVAVDQIGGSPARQFTGWDDEITLSGVIYTAFKGGLGQLDTLRGMLVAGVPYLLVDGRGIVHGQWAVKEVTGGQTNFQSAGAARRIQFTVSLAYYGA